KPIYRRGPTAAAFSAEDAEEDRTQAIGNRQEATGRGRRGQKTEEDAAEGGGATRFSRRGRLHPGLRSQFIFWGTELEVRRLWVASFAPSWRACCAAATGTQAVFGTGRLPPCKRASAGRRCGRRPQSRSGRHSRFQPTRSPPPRGPSG